MLRLGEHSEGEHMLRNLLAAAVGAAIIHGTATAALIDHGAYFSDTHSGLDWLHNMPLAGESYNSVLNGAGGFIGSGVWRFATGPELTDLVDFYVGLGTPPTKSGDPYENRSLTALLAAQSLIALLGINVAFGDPPDPRSTSQSTDPGLTEIATQGWYDDGTGGTLTGIFTFGAISLFPGPQPSNDVVTQILPDFMSVDDFGGQNVSAILVRVSTTVQVPTPSTLALLTVGLSGLRFCRSVTCPKKA
jgi:hypothetical protein